MTRKEKHDLMQIAWLSAMHEMGRAVAGMEPLTFDEWFGRRFPNKSKNSIKRNRR